MKYMFYGSQYNHPLGSWDVSQVESMCGMFMRSQCIIPWILGLSNVQSMIVCFCSKYNHLEGCKGRGLI